MRTGHQASSKATEVPIDSGSVISDHVILNNRRVSLEAEVTNTPVNAPHGKELQMEFLSLEAKYQDLRKGAIVKGGPGRNIGFSEIQVEVGGSPIEVTPAEWSETTETVLQAVDVYEDFDRPLEVYNALWEIMRTRTSVRVVSGLVPYETCILENMSAPEDVNDAIVFSLDFVEITTVDTQSVDLDPPVKELRAKKKKASGSKAGLEMPPEKQTTAKALLDKALALFGIPGGI